jgi:hypothetical protein
MKKVGAVADKAPREKYEEVLRCNSTPFGEVAMELERFKFPV